MTREEAIKLIEHISIAFVPTDQYGDYDDPQPYEEAIDMAIEALSEDIVRCKDCRHKQNDLTHNFCEINYHKCYDDDFCSWAERKGGDDECV